MPKYSFGLQIFMAKCKRTTKETGKDILKSVICRRGGGGGGEEEEETEEKIKRKIKS
jgi:hypothetical protein